MPLKACAPKNNRKLRERREKEPAMLEGIWMLHKTAIVIIIKWNDRIYCAVCRAIQSRAVENTSR
jgi:hypothetical protein